MSIRTYSLSEGGYLKIEYEAVGDKFALRTIKTDDQSVVSLAQLTINGIPAPHLRKLKSSIPPEGLPEIHRHRKQGEHYHLDFKNQWSWLSKDVRLVEITCRWRKCIYQIKILTCCKILGLIRALENTPGSTFTKGKKYLLLCKGLPLRESRSIEEYGLDEKDVVEVMVPSDLTGGRSSLQKATGGGYLSIPEFEKYTDQMKKKIGIVCQIIIPRSGGLSEYGTGFLIDRYLIITNAHVIADGLSGAVAKFFYHHSTTAHQEMEIGIDPQTVCVSTSPGNHKRPQAAALDYAILRLKPKMLSHTLKQAFEHLGRIAKEMFQKAQTAAQNPPSPEIQDQRFSRANIIQHPLFKMVSQPKQIAFHDNRVHDKDYLVLHYKSETQSGSSGSPVINDQGELIGIHYSDCFAMDKILFKHLIPLCARLGFALHGKDDTEYCFKKNDQFIYVYRDGKYEWQCSKNSDGRDKFNLNLLIFENDEQIRVGKSSLAAFILTFLQEQKEFLNEEHLYCNTAVHIDRIMDDLNKDPEKKQRLALAIQQSQQEWGAHGRRLFSITQVFRSMLHLIQDLFTFCRTLSRLYRQVRWVKYVTRGAGLGVLIGVALLVRRHFTPKPT